MPELGHEHDETRFDLNPLLSQVGNAGAQSSAAVVLPGSRHIYTAVFLHVPMDCGKLAFCFVGCVSHG